MYSEILFFHCSVWQFTENASELKYVLEGGSRMCYIVVWLCAPKIGFIKWYIHEIRSLSRNLLKEIQFFKN